MLGAYDSCDLSLICSYAIGTDEAKHTDIEWSSSNEIPSTSFTPTNVTVSFSQYLGLSMSFAINRRNISLAVNKYPEYHDILHELSDRLVVLYDTADHRGWLIDAERAVLQILLHSSKVRPGYWKSDVRFEVARSDQAKSVHAAMCRNGKLIMREGLDAETGKFREVPFSRTVKELWEKLRNLADIAKEHYQKSLHSSDLGFGKRAIYGFEYMGLVHSTGQAEKHPMKARLMSHCGQWPDLTDSLGAAVLLGRNFGELMSPGPNAAICPRFQTLPSSMSYLAADAKIIKRLLDRHSSPQTPWRLTATNMVWMVIQDPFKNCKNHPSSCCSCNVVQRVKKANNCTNLIKRDSLSQWEEGAVIFGRTDYLSQLVKKNKARHVQHTETYGGSIDVIQMLVPNTERLPISAPLPELDHSNTQRPGVPQTYEVNTNANEGALASHETAPSR